MTPDILIASKGCAVSSRQNAPNLDWSVQNVWLIELEKEFDLVFSEGDTERQPILFWLGFELQLANGFPFHSPICWPEFDTITSVNPLRAQIRRTETRISNVIEEPRQRRSVRHSTRLQSTRPLISYENSASGFRNRPHF